MIVSRAQQASAYRPKPVTSVEDTGLSLGFLSDLSLRIIYCASSIPGHEIARRLSLPYVNVVDRALEELKRQLSVAVRGGSAVSTASYDYALTPKGHSKFLELLEHSGCMGPPCRFHWRSTGRPCKRRPSAR